MRHGVRSVVAVVTKMVQGIAFLSKKNFNPANNSNQKRVWEAEQRKKEEEKRIRERQEQLKREREDEELALSRFGGPNGNSSGGRHHTQGTLRFMYDVPPGFSREKVEKTEQDCEQQNAHGKDVVSTSNSALAENDIAQRRPGDDDAAARFRLLFASSSCSSAAGTGYTDKTSDKNNDTVKTNNGHAAETVDTTSSTSNSKGKIDLRTQLEKEIGRRDTRSLTLEEQLERFPQLKNAPKVKGLNGEHVNVKFNPMGANLRQVKW